MKRLFLLLIASAAIISCEKQVKKPFFEEESYLAQYGLMYYPNIIEIIPSDSVDLTDTKYKTVHIDKYIFHKVLFSFDTISRSYYPYDTTQIGSLIWNDDSGLYDKALYLITSRYFDILDTTNVVQKDASSLTFGINKALASSLFISAYDKYTQRNKVSFLANEGIHFKVHYRGNQPPIEVAKFINTRFNKQAMYGWVQNK